MTEENVILPDFEELDTVHQQRLRELISIGFIDFQEFFYDAVDEKYLELDAAIKLNQAQQQSMAEEVEDEEEDSAWDVDE